MKNAVIEQQKYTIKLKLKFTVRVFKTLNIILSVLDGLLKNT